MELPTGAYAFRMKKYGSGKQMNSQPGNQMYKHRTSRTRIEAHEGEVSFPPRAYAWYVVAVIFIAGSFAFIDRIVVSLVTPALQADLGLRDSQLGMLQGLAFALFYVLFGIPLGIIADRWNRQRLLTVGISIWSLMTASCGLCTGFGSLFLARLGVGAGEASLNPSVTSLISDYFPPRVRPRAIAGYVMGQGFGHGLTYVFGGMLLGWLATRGGLVLPVLGHVKPWQAMFLIVGVAGLFPTLLFGLTVREPKRLEIANKSTGRASAADVIAFMRLNRMTLACHHFGIALTTMTAIGFANWMPTFFLRVHHWPPQRFSVFYGAINIIFGIGVPLAAGWLATWWKERGTIDAAWRLALYGSIGCTVCGALAPLMPTPELSLAVYILAGLCASPPAVLAYVAISEFVPNEMRGTIIAVYFLVSGLVSNGFGPVAVGLATDYLFKDNAAIGRSLSFVSFATGLPAAVLLMAGLRSFRQSIGRATWVARASTQPPVASGVPH
jgi:MFS family permease